VGADLMTARAHDLALAGPEGAARRERAAKSAARSTATPAAMAHARALTRGGFVVAGGASTRDAVRAEARSFSPRRRRGERSASRHRCWRRRTPGARRGGDARGRSAHLFVAVSGRAPMVGA
jgi:hypothetical protein